MSQEATSTVFMIVVMIALFYFMLYRPQKKQAAKRKALLDSLEVGADVVTIGGVYGRIQALDAQTVKLEVAPGTVMTFARAAVNGKVAKETEAEDED
ncbi:MAG: preprotein translocase subunit YajC [Selenomonadaceae bacterium]|nr:preprotein translocase subunit YajC [Selenomonadaceae bacterium]